MSQRANAWLVVVAALCGIWLVQQGADGTVPPQPSAAAFAESQRPTSPVATPLAPSAPVRIRIPRIRVDAPMMRLGLGADGSLDVPPAGNSNIAGWFKDGTPPGARGTAIVAGHVDNAQGPAVFYALGSLTKGAEVEIVREDGRTAVFSVDAAEVYESEDFPDERVYGPAKYAALRLITCGGGFSRETGYRGNVVVYAHLTHVR